LELFCNAQQYNQLYLPAAVIGIGVVGGAVVSTVVVVGNAVVVSANIVTCAAFHCLILRKDN